MKHRIVISTLGAGLLLFNAVALAHIGDHSAQALAHGHPAAGPVALGFTLACLAFVGLIQQRRSKSGRHRR